ncbi:asparagine synthase (glutamine-hydrolyzing) [Prosthecobacter sp.]|uniref:asparagine synthase (glutamine-hydrolyzing) n=1 Tax=Prosthecobacter sp. TaxID=1965333 RepID=UPI001D9787CF|nr:asparagine synthase (glutamine-hydrolyzing) [Prosthecobacter sp.]MCB1277434.1 asparagine synthase (glutamine-hydrolyzing) [Prosthecobacter sp.]
MCGIAGFFAPAQSRPSHEMDAIVTAMTDAIVLRGPDDAGAWVDSTNGIALGHRRLSILDLSPLGHQPMDSADGRFVIVFNGEIYNFQDLRAELEPLGHSWRGHSDTEIMLAAFCQWGVVEATKRFNGMFAFAVWDRQERVMHLARDRMGEKPLYYGWVGETFVFASELKAIQRFPGFNASVDREALTSLLRFNYIPDPLCIYQGFKKLPPATMLTLKSPSERPQPNCYWSLPRVVEHGLDHPFTGTEAEAIDAFEALLKKAVGMRMISDVPLGAFLSGGIDSSLIVAMMQAQSARPVRTFTIGFHEKQYNEAEVAKSVAAHLGTEHTEMYVTGEDALNVIPQLPALYDEPFADYSQIPTHLVCKMARQHVTVALSGDAGDELFGGYERYAMGRSIWDRISWMPPVMKRLTAEALTLLPPGVMNTVGAKLLPKRLRHIPVGDKLHKLAEVVAAPGVETLYLNLMSYWKKPTDIVIDGQDPVTAITNTASWPRVSDFTHRMMHLDMETYLPGDILVKVDRAAMGVSLEGRIPLLDTELIEFAWRIPYSMKVRNGKGKWLMRETLYRHVPKALIDRPKQGFGIPLEIWLRGPLREWAEDLLSESRLKREGFFHPAPIRQKWQEHLSGTRNWHFYLWDILMFQAWLQANKL